MKYKTIKVTTKVFSRIEKIQSNLEEISRKYTQTNARPTKSVVVGIALDAYDKISAQRLNDFLPEFLKMMEEIKGFTKKI